MKRCDQVSPGLLLLFAVIGGIRLPGDDKHFAYSEMFDDRFCRNFIAAHGPHFQSIPTSGRAFGPP